MMYELPKHGIVDCVCKQCCRISGGAKGESPRYSSNKFYIFYSILVEVFLITCVSFYIINVLLKYVTSYVFVLPCFFPFFLF